MSILIVDDSPPVIRQLQATLERAGYQDIHCVDSGHAALSFLGIDPPTDEFNQVDCILLDIIMPGIDGIEVCGIIKNHDFFSNTPIIMVTVKDDPETLRDAFNAGAFDYITKPARELELLARVKTAITVTREIEARKARERELLQLKEKLEEANQLLTELSVTDEITKVGNRRYFTDCLENEWRRSFRESAPLSIIFVDIDRFNDFCKQFDQVKGDECLKLIAQVLQISLRRAGDQLARYRNSQFAIYLPKTDLNGAKVVAEYMRMSVEALRIESGEESPTYVSVSQGISCVIPSGGMAIDNLLTIAEEALTQARTTGDTIVCLQP